MATAQALGPQGHQVSQAMARTQGPQDVSSLFWSPTMHRKGYASSFTQHFQEFL